MITDELLFRYLNQETDEKENRQIQQWLTAHPEQNERINRLNGFLAIPGLGDETEISHDWVALENKFNARQLPIRQLRTIYNRIALAAALFLLLAGSGALWYFQAHTHVIRNNDTIAKSIYLPDGTSVDLGPGSKLVYESEFLNGNREIRLTGDACFDVTSDPEHPFIVLAGLTKIKVTGTRFIVNAPSHSPEIEVMVKKGNVLFYNSETFAENSFRMGLVAGEKGIFNPDLNRMDKTRDPDYQTNP